jgi:CBS domain-containing protein
MRGRSSEPGVVVQAAEIDEQFPVVDIDSPALEAARMLAEHSLPGIVVVTADGQLYAVLPASQVVRFIVPSYVQDDPLLARVLAESMADRAAEKLGGKTLRELVPQRQLTLPAVNADDTILEVAATMGRLRSPLIAVMKQGRLHGVITTSRLLTMALKCGLTEQAWTAVVTGFTTERASSLSTWQVLEQSPDQIRSTA